MSIKIIFNEQKKVICKDNNYYKIQIIKYYTLSVYKQAEFI